MSSFKGILTALTPYSNDFRTGEREINRKEKYTEKVLDLAIFGNGIAQKQSHHFLILPITWLSTHFFWDFMTTVCLLSLF